jgi:hypothetical protein
LLVQNFPTFENDVVEGRKRHLTRCKYATQR